MCKKKEWKFTMECYIEWYVGLHYGWYSGY